jgi:hypothetical protein
MMNEEKYVVLSDKEIKQKMAGHKSAYTKRINAAKTSKERKELEAGRDAYLACIESAMRDEQKKMIQRRAGHLSWITRKANQEKVNAEAITTTCKKNKTSKKSCSCSVKVSNKKR